MIWICFHCSLFSSFWLELLPCKFRLCENGSIPKRLKTKTAHSWIRSFLLRVFIIWMMCIEWDFVKWNFKIRKNLWNKQHFKFHKKIRFCTSLITRTAKICKKFVNYYIFNITVGHFTFGPFWSFLFASGPFWTSAWAVLVLGRFGHFPVRGFLWEQWECKMSYCYPVRLSTHQRSYSLSMVDNDICECTVLLSLYSAILLGKQGGQALWLVGSHHCRPAT